MSPMIDHVAELILSVFLIFGVYQFYFWCQTNPLALKPRFLRLPVDDQIPYRPRWVWIYSFLYYPVILFITLTTDSSRTFLYVAVSYVGLLFIQMTVFILFPVVTPAEWRTCNNRGSWSERLLAFVQRRDAPSNSFPSMHTSVAVLTALHLQPMAGAAIFAFPIAIGLSCLYTKQHYFIDVPAGALAGWMAFGFFRFIC
jgi:membrane-associated phospholipid phosphatase